jgi:hypothetical protein
MHVHRQHLFRVFRGFRDVLPDLIRDQIQTLLREMKKDGLVHAIGRAHCARWFPGVEKDNSNT